MEIKHINPESMAKPRGYSHAISITGNHKTIYVGGQNCIDENGVLVGKNSLKLQTEQALININKILKSAGAKLENVIKFNNLYFTRTKPTGWVSGFSRKME